MIRFSIITLVQQVPRFRVILKQVERTATLSTQIHVVEFSASQLLSLGCSPWAPDRIYDYQDIIGSES